MVREGSTFYISTQGVLGAPYVEIVPGPLDAPALGAESPPQRGVDPPRTDLLMARAYELLDAAGGLLEDNQDVVVELFQAGGGVARTLDEVLQENRGAIQRGLSSLSSSAERLDRLTLDLEAGLGAGGTRGLITDLRETAALLREELPGTLSQTQAAMTQLSRLGGSLDEAQLEELREGLRVFTALGGRLEATTTKLDALMGQIERGEGSLGALVQDDQVYEDLRELLRDLKAHPWKLVWKD